MKTDERNELDRIQNRPSVLDALITQGFEGNAELESRFLGMAKAIEAFEDSIPLMPIRVPDTLPAVV